MNQKSILDWAKKDSSGCKRKFDDSELTNQKEELKNQSKIAKTEIKTEIPIIRENQSDDSRSETCSPSLFEPEVNDRQPGSLSGMTLSQTNSEISFIPDTQDMNENQFKSYSETLNAPQHHHLKNNSTVQILYDLKNPTEPYPKSFIDVWDENHVRMPFSKKNIYPVKNGDKKELCSRWELIQNALRKELLCAEDLEDAILSYNMRFKSSWNFRLLNDFFQREATLEERQTFFDSTLPKMQQIVLSSKDYFHRPPILLKKHSNKAIYLSQQQCGALLVMAFFCVFPRRNSFKSNSEYATYNSINFNRVFSLPLEPHNFEKLRTLLNYFNRLCNHPSTGVVSFHRCRLETFPDWSTAPERLSQVRVDSRGLIEEEGSKYIQMDFANKYIGGGVLGHGLVQEEIRFIISPELIVTMLLTEKLEDDECLLMTGAEKYSSYSGYANSYKFENNHEDIISRDSLSRKLTHVVAMDAIPFYDDPSEQYLMTNIIRDLNKSYVSFVSNNTNQSAIATGNWGCGAFCGNPHLKFIIQLMSAAISKRDLIYFTFHDHKLKAELDSIYSHLNQKTVGQIFDLLSDYEPETCSLFEFISQING